MTVRDLILSSLRVIGVLSKSENPSSDEMNDSLQALNMVLGSWSVQGIIVRAMTLESLSVVLGTGSYSIGTGATFNTAKPSRITNAFLRDSNGLDSSLEIITMQDWENIEDKSFAEGRPGRIAYNPGSAQQATQAGTLYFDVLPDANYTLWLESEKGFTQLTSTSANATFEDQYIAAIKWNLAQEIWPEYYPNTPTRQDIIVNAAKYMRVLESLNSITP
jgi:hypothetical protein